MKQVTLAIICVLVLCAGNTLATTIEVSQPTQMSSNSYYERGNSVLKDGSGNYWLFYGRSTDCQGHYGNSNPDNNHYVIYYKEAGTISGLEAATAQPVGHMPSTTEKIYQGQTSCVAYDGKVWVFAVDMGDGGGQVKAWTTTDGGTTWSVEDVLPAGTDPFEGSHLWATVYGSKIWLVVNRGGDLDVTTYDGSWSALHEAVDHEGMPRFYVDSGNLYLYYTSWGLPAYYIYQWGGDTTWTIVATITGTPDLDCDPMLTKVGSEYMFIFSPWNPAESKQFLKYWTAATIAGFDGLDQTTAKLITAGGYGGTNWVDMWPATITDGGDVYIFYGSEADGTDRGTGNIYMLELDWDLVNDHYCYIQNAIDQANSGDVVNVVAGTYDAFEANKADITVQGSSSPVISGPGISVDGQTVGVLVSAHGVTVKGLTVDPAGDDYSTGMYIYNASTPPHGVTLDGNVVDQIGYDPELHSSWGGGGIMAKAGSGATAVIKNNTVTFGPSAVRGHNGINIFGQPDDPAYAISGNTVTIYECQKYQVAINVRTGATAGATVIDNTITCPDKTPCTWTRVFGIWLYGGGWDCAKNLTVSGNTVHDVDYALWVTGPNTASISITGNDFYNSLFGVVVEDQPPLGTVVINDNDIFDNCELGLYNEAGNAALDAEDNWWGSGSGPSHASNTYTNPGGDPQGNGVSDNVDFVPWLDAAYPIGVSFAPVALNSVWDYASIQGAVDDATPGDNIKAKAGTYDESVIINTDNLTITGLGFPIVNGGSGAFLISANGGTLEGFDAHSSDYAVIWVNGNDVTVRDNLVTGNISCTPVQANGYCAGIYVIGTDVLPTPIWPTPELTAISIEGNTVTQTGGPGIAFNRVAYSTITDNFIHDLSSIGDGIQLLSTRCKPSHDNNVDENTIANVSVGIKVVNSHDNTLQANTLDDCSFSGIWLHSFASALIPGCHDPSDNIIVNNEIRNNGKGIYLSAVLSSWSTVTDHAYSNSIDGNGVAVDNEINDVFDASGNWWGDNDPVAVAAMVSDYVDYTPWLDSGTDMGTTTPGFQGDFSALWVDDDSPQTGTAGRIQEGIDLVTGGKVYCVSGEYYGATVDKAVNLRGMGDDLNPVVINDGPNLGAWPLTIGFYFPGGRVGSGAKISHFTFEGTGDPDGLAFPVFSRGADRVQVMHNKMINSLQAITNWHGDSWTIAHNNIDGIWTWGGGGIGIFVGCWNGSDAQRNRIMHNTLLAEIVPEEEPLGYSTPGIVLMSDCRYGRQGGDVKRNSVEHNEVVFTGHDDAVGCELTDLSPEADEVTDNRFRFNVLEPSVKPWLLYPWVTVWKNNSFFKNVPDPKPGPSIASRLANPPGPRPYGPEQEERGQESVRNIQSEFRRGGMTAFALSQNNPNPFSRETAISYSLPASGHTTLRVYDGGGRIVETLVDEEMGAGVYSVTWNRKDATSGVYFYRLSSSGKTMTKKMVVVR